MCKRREPACAACGNPLFDPNLRGASSAVCPQCVGAQIRTMPARFADKLRWTLNAPQGLFSVRRRLCLEVLSGQERQAFKEALFGRAYGVSSGKIAERASKHTKRRRKGPGFEFL